MGGSLPSFSLGFIKGEAPTTSVTALLLYIKHHNINVQTLMPKLRSSLLEVFVHVYKPVNQLAVALGNMKL